jgi:hypothetical protein
MVTAIRPFPLSKKLPPQLARMHRVWNDLIRSENEMPFSDDVDLSAFSTVSANLIVIDVFTSPQRFRFNHLGEKVIRKCGANIVGQFADEVEAKSPLDYFMAQASATVEARAPTFYASSSSRQKRAAGYKRVLLPTWGNGRVDLLLGAIV